MAGRKAFKFRAYPTRLQVEALELHLREACHLYNAALQERRDAWKMSRTRVSCYDQDKQLTEIRAAGDIGITNSRVAREVLRRVDRAFAAFFRRVKGGQTPGYPRFKSSSRYDSLTFPEPNSDWTLANGRVALHGFGSLKVKVHRPVTGRPRTLSIKREGTRWFVILSVDQCEDGILSASHEATGIDVGLSAFAMLSGGGIVEAPRLERASAKRVRIARRRLARRKRGSAGRREAARLLAQAQAKIRNQRSDFHHKVSRSIVNRFGLIAVEDLNVKGLARTRLARSVRDAGWSQFLDKLAYKAESAGRVFVRVNPRGTSQACSSCGEIVEKSLSERRHVCACGLDIHRDVNAARNILRLGLSLRGGTWPIGASVPCEAVAS